MKSIPAEFYSWDPQALKRIIVTLTTDASAGKLPVNAAKSAGVTAIISSDKPYRRPVGGKIPQSLPTFKDQEENFVMVVCLFRESHLSSISMDTII